jgi:ssDNA-binding Zn-finger/Zn-ribbon topoisomerase 1
MNEEIDCCPDCGGELVIEHRFNLKLKGCELYVACSDADCGWYAKMEQEK